MVMLDGGEYAQLCGVIPQMAESCSINPSMVSREFIVASEEELSRPCERFGEVDLRVLSIARVCSSACNTVDIR